MHDQVIKDFICHIKESLGLPLLGNEESLKYFKTYQVCVLDVYLWL